MPTPTSPFRHLHRRRRHHHPPPKPTSTPPPNPPTYTRSTIHTISSLLRYSPWSSAQSELLRLPLRWDSFTVNQVLKTHPPLHKAWLFFNWAPLHLPHFKHDRFTYTTMLDIFGEARRIASMRLLFLQMRDSGIPVDAAVYTSIMHWLAKDGDIEGAVAAWEEMRTARGCRPTLVSYTAFMKVLFEYGREEEAAGVYREMIEVGLTPNCRTYTVLMEYLAGAGKFQAALEVMNEMQVAGIQPDKAACNILVQKCSVARETAAITRILHYMKENRIVLRRPIFLIALEAFKISGESDQLLREVNPHLAFEGIEEEMSDFESSSTDTSSLIDRSIVINLLARQNFVAIEHVLRDITEKRTQIDSELISTIVQTNCAHYRPSGALMALHYGWKTNRKLDRSAYVSLLGLFIRTRSFEKVLEIVEKMVKDGISLGTYLVSLLIYKLGCAGLSTAAEKIFHSFATDHNIVTYTALISAHFQSGEVDKGLELYSRMRRQGIPVSSGTYEALIVGLDKAGRIHDAEIYRKEKRKLQWNNQSLDKVSVDESLCNCLFDGY